MLSAPQNRIRPVPLLVIVVFVAVGVLQYLDGEWRLLAALFVLAGLGQPAAEGVDRYRTGRQPA